MKRILAGFLCLVCLCGCGYDSGYAAGFKAGMAAAQAESDTRSIPEYTPFPTIRPIPTFKPIEIPVYTLNPTEPAEEIIKGIESRYGSVAPTESPTTTPTPRPTPRPTPVPTQSPKTNDFTVYVSRTGTMHLKANCSGMKYYTEMPYSVASQYYSKKCSHCFK